MDTDERARGRDDQVGRERDDQVRREGGDLAEREAAAADATGTADDAPVGARAEGEPARAPADVSTPFPERPLPDWKVLVTAAEAYPEMERLVMSAERELFLGLHVFQGDTALRSEEALAAGHEVWSDLLRAAMERGVSVRILLTDFDPAGIPALHVTAWRRVKELLESMREHIERMPDLFELQVVLPAGQVGIVQRRVFWPPLYLFLRRWAEDHPDEVPFAPGWWSNLTDPSEPPFRVRPMPPKLLSSATLHQKFLVADAERGVIGGLDIDERRYDDPKHRRDAPETWHDVTLRVDGPIAGDLAAHFRECWDRNLVSGTTLLPDYIERHGLTGARATPFDAPPREARADEGGERGEGGEEASIRLLRTVSRHDPSPVALGPREEITEIEEAYVEAIGEARSLIYIESQYLRAGPVREALVRAGEREKGLGLIIVLPGAPEDVAYEGRAGSIQRYGEWLQSRFVHALRKVYGDRFALSAIVHERERTEMAERDAIFGRGMVYVHSKLMTVDDRTAIVGSANLNGRSMRWDTELCVRVRGRAFVNDLKQRLFDVHLLDAAKGLAEEADGLKVVRAWRSDAEERAVRGRTEGGAVPFPERKMHRFSKRSLFIPENMV